MKTSVLTLVTGITLLAGICRFVAFTTAPSSLNWDETSFGYISFSLLKTGRDEFGEAFPLQFRSVGDFKNPMYAYLGVLPTAIFGLNETSVRFTPALLSTLTVGLFFLAIYKLSGKKDIAALAGVFIAISPWHLQFGRAGADVPVSSFFVILGLTLAVYGRFKLAGMLMAGSLYSYFGEKLFTPLFALLTSGYIAKRFEIKKAIIFLFCFGVTLLPLVQTFLTPGHSEKIYKTTLLSYTVPERTGFDSRPIVYLGMFGLRYLSHFSPSFLITTGPDDWRQRIWGMGMMYGSEFLLLGISVLFWKKLGLKNKWFFVMWLLLGPIPAAITKDATHARRALNMIYPLEVFVASGVVLLYSMRKKFAARATLGVISIFLVFGILYYVGSYYVFTPLRGAAGAGGWQYGYKQVVEKVTPIAGKYKNVVVDTSYQGPYIFFLFFQNYPPKQYQQQANLEVADVLSLGESRGYDNYHFMPVFWPGMRGDKNTLFVAPPERIPKKDIDGIHSHLLDVVYFPDQTEAFYIVAND